MDIEEYLLNIYKSDKKMHRKIYYHKNKEKLLAYNNQRYANRYNNDLLQGIKIIKKEFIIKFD
jgi:hypothetical protein